MMGTVVKLDEFREVAEKPAESVMPNFSDVMQLYGTFSDSKNSLPVTGVYFIEDTGLAIVGTPPQVMDVKSDHIVIEYRNGSYEVMNFDEAVNRLSPRDTDALHSFRKLAEDRADAIDFEIETSRPRTASFARSPAPEPTRG